MLNQKKPQLFRDYYGKIPVLLFEPAEVYLFQESPSLRREFLNRALFLENPQSVKVLREYNEVVAQKNRLLKEGSPFQLDGELPVWNEKLAHLGSTLIWQRLSWIEKINAYLTGEYRSLSKGNGEVGIQYHCSIPDIQSEGDLHPVQEISDAFEAFLREREKEEKKKRESLVGPHRDDWSVLKNGESLGEFGSQGENRCGVIALKLSQIKMFEKEAGFCPIFLLDDVASELDETRREALFSYLNGASGQVLITATDFGKIANDFNKIGSSFLVEEGSIRVLG